MDPKKQDLNPELKQIYDRVMNTQVPNKPSGTEPLQNVTPTPSPQPSISTPQGPTQAAPLPPQPAAPQPISEPKSFVFTGNKVITPQDGGQGTTQTAGTKKGIPGILIGVLVVILVIAWGALWAKIFGLF